MTLRCITLSRSSPGSRARGRASTVLFAALLGTLAPEPAAAQAVEIPTREAAAKAAPKDLGAQTALGTAYLRAGRYVDAAKQFERAEALAPLDPAAVTRRAEVAIAQGDYKQARNQCKKLFKEQKGSPLAHVCMARAFLAWNRSERAFEELAAATAQDPNLGEAQLVLGHAHRIRNQVSEAETAYKRAKENRALAAEAELGLGRLYAAAGRKGEATTVLREALAAEPQWPEVQYELGLLLGSSPEARTLLTQAVSGRPGWAEPARALGDALKQAGEFDAAAVAYRQALAVDRTLVAAHLGLGEALLAKQQLGEAEAAVKAAIALVANDPRATLVLAEVQVKQGLIDEALDTFRHAADLDPKNPTGLVRAAEVCLEHKRSTLAAGFLDRLLSAHPTNPKALVLYGDIMRARGDKSSAKQYYDRAVSAGGQLDAARMQLK